MFIKTTVLTCGIFVLTSDLVFALSCARPDPERIAKDYETVFVAFVTEGHFVEGEDAEECGWIEGYFEVEEELKGNPDSVSVIRKRLVNCNGKGIGGASDSFPIGKNILVKTNSEIGNFGLCDYSWDGHTANCLVDALQRQLNIDAPDIEVRERCKEFENSRGGLQRAEDVRSYILLLEKERAEIDAELEEMKEMLENSESSQEEY